MKTNLVFSKLYTFFNYVFLGLFALILILITLFNDNTFFAAEPLNLVICTVLGASVIALLCVITNFCNKFTLKTEVLVLAMLFLGFFIVQLIAGEMLLVYPNQGWDFGVVYSFAKENVLNGALPTEYFVQFSNNSALYLIFCSWFSLLQNFGILEFLYPTFVLNIIIIDVSLLLLYLTARHCLGKAMAFLALSVAFITLPFITYTPIIYSDTLTLPFVIGCVLLWLHCKKSYAEQKNITTFILAFAIVVISILGSLIKPTVLIVFIAICIDALFSLKHSKGAKKYLLFVFMLILALLLRQGMSTLVTSDDRLPDFDKSQSIPMVHWAMMGLVDKGGYYDPDVQFTLSAGDYDARVQANLEEIANRISAMGFVGFMEHLAQKLSFIYSDGMYYSSEKLNRGVIDIGFLHDYVIYTSHGYGIVSYYTFGIMAGMFCFVLIGCFVAIKNKANELTFCRIAIFGLTLFLLIFEARSRYLVNFLPLFILLETEGCKSAKNFLRVKLSAKISKKRSRNLT